MCHFSSKFSLMFDTGGSYFVTRGDVFTSWKLSVGLKWFYMSRIDCPLNIFPLYVIVSRNVASVSEIVNIIGW